MKCKEEKTEDLVLNIPTKLAIDHVSNKIYFLLLQFACCIKNTYPDSRMPNLTDDAIMNLGHCGKVKAGKINRAIKSGEYSELFHYNPYNKSVVAKNFKKKYTKKTTDKNGKEIWYTPVLPIARYKLNKETGKYEKITFTLRYVEQEIRRLLLTDIIDRSKDKGRDKYYLYQMNLFAPSSPTQKTMAKAIGNQSTRTVSRRLKELEEESRIEKVQSPKLSYIDNFRSSGNKVVEAKTKNRRRFVIDQRSGSVYEAMPNKYRLTGRGLSKPRLIVFNYERRLQQYLKKGEDCLFDKWDR